MTSDGTQQPASHEDIRHHFDEAVDEIRRGMIEMGALVVENIKRVGEAMVETRLDLVDQIREADQEVNALYANLEKKVFDTLARQQPAGSDLRFLVSATRILYELERSGDLAVNCANTLARQNGFPAIPQVIGLLEQLTSATAEVFSHGLDAIVNMDEQSGFTLETEDDVVDDLVSLYYTEIGQRSEELGLENSIAMSRIGRFMERIADHAVNVGENVTYIVTASFPGDTHAALNEETE